MVFSSITFFVFFACVIVLMLVTKIKRFAIQRLRHGILLVTSYIFYGWWDWRFCFLMLGLTIIAYGSALFISRYPMNTLYVIIGVVIPLFILGIFKYFNFFSVSFAKVFGIKNIGSLNIILPVGISFYTFQALSYTIDVYRKKIAAEQDFLKLALYIAFFPQLVAGPIVRASDFLPQLEEDRNISWHNFIVGIQIFIFGLFKKVVVADWLSVFVDDIFTTPEAFHAVSLIFAVVAYAVQIYFDFSGYSDMATGCAKCLGYDFTRNFNLPYSAGNISEFWRRWHISLSSWLKEYVYIPLGGNRKGPARTYLNQMLTMILGGLWHGANWTFVVWGCAHGIALCIHKMFCSSIKKLTAKSCFGSESHFTKTGWYLLSNIVTNIFVCFCWIFFRAENFTVAGKIIKGIFVWQDGILQVFSWAVIAVILVVFASFAAIAVSYTNMDSNKPFVINGFYPLLNLSKWLHMVIFFIVIGLIAGLAYTGANPFIYFQF